MTCDRCLPEQPCLNHEVQARSATFQRERDHREALARGKARYARNITTGRGM